MARIRAPVKMGTPEKSECENIWQAALEACRDTLGEVDFEIVQSFNSADEMLQKIQSLGEERPSGSMLRAINRLKPQLGHLQTFVGFMLMSIGSKTITSAAILGSTFLLIELASHSGQDLEEISQNLNEMGENLKLFELYRKSAGMDPELLESFFRILMDLTLTCAIAIKHHRKYDAFLSPGWSTVQNKFAKTLKDLSGKVDRLRKSMEEHQFTELIQSLKRYQENEMSPQVHVQLPYLQLPFGRNPAFFGRTDLLTSLQNHLKPLETGKSTRSVALWGTGGIGKSQVALEYASIRNQQNCSVLWLPSETESETMKALADAASHIKPPGYIEGLAPERVRFVMWKWLQTTETPWLIIFDNVEDNKLLLQNWPSTGNVEIVVTCRSELLAASPAAKALEILPFTLSESTQLLLRLSQRQNAETAEVEAAEQIAGMMDGLALAIDIIARQIFVRKMPMRDFLPYFIENRRFLRAPSRYAAVNPYYSRTLETVWQTAFDSLTTAASTLLSILCFLAPDGIPRRILDPRYSIAMVGSPLSTTAQHDFAEQELLNLSLVRMNVEKKTMSIHRLTQEAYFYAMTEEKQRVAFDIACCLMCHAFPKREKGIHLYRRWKECEELVAHVVALQYKYEESRSSGLSNQNAAFARLMADATWYLGETGTLQLGAKVGKRAAEAWSDKESLEYAYICESIATIDHRWGRYASAHEYFQQALSIRKSSPTTTPNVLADSYSAVGLALLGLYRSEEAIIFVNLALEIVDKVSEDEKLNYNVDRYLRNRARPRAMLGRFKLAKDDIAAADAFQTKVYGEDSHFHGETAYILGKIAAQEGEHVRAMEYLERAFKLQSSGKPFHQSVAAARYHQALVCMRRPGNREQNYKEALSRLEHSQTVSQFNDARRGDQGHSARVMWRISQIWEAQGLLEDAALYRKTAEKAKAELEASNLYPKAPDEEQSWDCFSDLLDR